jgi:diacylglycerol kinase (ATP)
MIIIANPKAGHGRGAQSLSQVEAFLSERHIVHRTAVSERPGHVTDLAAEAAGRGESPIVLVGGDGTLFEAVNGMAKAGRFLPVAQIPVGTGNSFIKDLGVESVEDGLRALTGGRTRAVDVGRVRSAAGEYHFVNLVGAGFVASVVSRASSLKLFGDLSYKIGVMLELVVLKAASCRLTVDGKESVRDALFVEVCNSRKTGGEMIMAPSAVVDDGLFDVVVARAMSRGTLLKLFPLIFRGEHVKDPHVEVLRGSRISVSFEPPQWVTPDGEILGKTPLDIEVVPRALEVFCL